uniref:Synaptotagmin like 3 n=1 Tax=Latimeria chalumnae TaxID=7897 RepID=H3A0N0_LATCH
ITQDMDLSFLKELEREKVLDVLYRDQMLRKAEEERIRNRKLKAELQELRKRGAKRFTQEYKTRTCARCQKPLGLVINSGAVCMGCSHRVCGGCRISIKGRLWRCTVCYAHGEIKVKTGEWFFEQRAKKFSFAEGRRETTGERLLKSYERTSKISIVPPTPPPFVETMTGSSSVILAGITHSRGFTKSMENILLSVTTHMKKISKSQNDMREDKTRLTTDYGQNNIEKRKERRSQSDTAISTSAKLASKGSLPNIFKKAREETKWEKTETKQVAQEQEARSRSTSLFSTGIRRDSMCSINSTCSESGNYDNANVTGEIELAIKYNFKSYKLEICIKSCKNLAYGEERKKKCNPYVKTYLLPDTSPQSKLKTSIKKNTMDPVFNETLKYSIERSQLETRTLQVSMWHAGTLKPKVFLGEVLIPLESWQFEENSTQSYNWYQLKAKVKCHEHSATALEEALSIISQYKIPSDPRSITQTKEGSIQEKMNNVGQLHIAVMGAKNLPSLRSDGVLNPFVKSCLTLPSKQELKQKTPVLKKKTSPQWKHLFMYDGITQSELEQSQLDLTVWDQATFGLTDCFLGGARLDLRKCAGDSAITPSGEPGSPSQFLWPKVLNKPNKWIDFTLVLH